jgi:hypothetical protein
VVSREVDPHPCEFVRLSSRQPNLYRGCHSVALTGRVREDFLANNLDRKARKAGPNNRPDATKQPISAAIHPGYFWPSGENRDAM